MRKENGEGAARCGLAGDFKELCRMCLGTAPPPGRRLKHSFTEFPAPQLQTTTETAFTSTVLLAVAAKTSGRYIGGDHPPSYS